MCHGRPPRTYGKPDVAVVVEALPHADRQARQPDRLAFDLLLVDGNVGRIHGEPHDEHDELDDKEGEEAQQSTMERHPYHPLFENLQACEWRYA